MWRRHHEFNLLSELFPSKCMKPSGSLLFWFRCGPSWKQGFSRMGHISSLVALILRLTLRHWEQYIFYFASYTEISRFVLQPLSIYTMSDALFNANRIILVFHIKCYLAIFLAIFGPNHGCVDESLVCMESKIASGKCYSLKL